MIKSLNRECLLYLSHVTWTAACYEDSRKIKEIAAATYTCISSFKKLVFRLLWTGLFFFFQGGNNVVYDVWVLLMFVDVWVLLCFVLFRLLCFVLSFSFFFMALVLFILVSFFFVKLTSVTLASIVSIWMSVILLFLIMSKFYQSGSVGHCWNANDGKEYL